MARARSRASRAADGTMSLGEHIRELRNRIVISVLAVLAGGIIAFVFRNHVLHFLTKPLCDQAASRKLSPDGSCTLVVSGVLDAFTISLKVSIYVGILISAPIWLWQLWRFITPGLKSKERSYVVSFVTSSTVLFLGGAAVAYLVLPKGLQFLLGFGGDTFTPLIQATKYISFMLAMMLMFGIAFEFPLLVVMLNIAGVVSAKQLSSWRRMEIFLVTVFAAFATPSQDPYTMAAMAVPMCLMYEGAVLIARLHDRRVKRASTEPDFSAYSDDEATPLQSVAPLA